MPERTSNETFTTDFQRRDFSGPVVLGLPVLSKNLSWTAFGGPERAELKVSGPAEKLMALTGLLRCGVIIRDSQGEPVWWGYVEDVEIELEDLEVRVSLADLANQVSMRYDFISPDNRVGDRSLTDTAVDLNSQAEYGIKEHLLIKRNIDDEGALAWRDTWLAQHAWPKSQLSQRTEPGESQARLTCSGWFKTFAWKSYTYTEGFYANYGPGPGSFAFGNSNNSIYIGQSFLPGADSDLKYAYFLLRNVGGATRTLTARLHSDINGVPGTVLATSDPVSPVALPNQSYAWAKFCFATAYPLMGGSHYWITLDPNGENAAAYFMLRLDQNINFPEGEGRYYNQTAGTWNLFPPEDRPDTIFRLVCVSETSEQLLDIARCGGQFFKRITVEATGIRTSPFRAAGLSCLAEIESLLKLGTQNQRLVLAKVSPERHLRFYEQPNPDEVDIYLDRHSRFYTAQGVPLKPWFPPVGRFARLSGSNRINLPWDKHRLPACFIAGAAYNPETGQLRIRTLERDDIS
jgi:hypothetical protein